jgi:hypothetical protein
MDVLELLPGNLWIRMAIGAVLQNKTCTVNAPDCSSEEAITCWDDASLKRPERSAIDLVFVSEQTNTLLVVSKLECNVILGLGLALFVPRRGSHDPVMDVLATEVVHQENGVRACEDGRPLCVESGCFIGQEELDRGFHTGV